MNKQQYIENTIKIIQLELENYNMTADYDFRLSMEDVINHIQQINKT